MIGLLLQIFVSLVVAMGIGLGVGLVLGRRQFADRPVASTTTPVDVTMIEEIVDREAELIERLSQAEDDLRAHAVELADANEEITALLDQLYEARSIAASDTPPLR